LLYDRLIWTVLSYGVKIWRKEEGNREVGGEISEMGIGGRSEDTGIYGKEELQRDKSRGRTKRRAWAYEKKLDEEEEVS